MTTMNQKRFPKKWTGLLILLISNILAFVMLGIDVWPFSLLSFVIAGMLWYFGGDEGPKGPPIHSDERMNNPIYVSMGSGRH